MGSYWRHTYHLVWATRNREPLIAEAVVATLHAFLAEKALELECEVFAINGMEDHVHMVLSIPPKHSVSSVIQKLKGASSHHINSMGGGADGHFAWQEGFGSLTVSDGNRHKAVDYVEKQKQHHAQLTASPALEVTGSWPP